MLGDDDSCQNEKDHGPNYRKEHREYRAQSNEQSTPGCLSYEFFVNSESSADFLFFQEYENDAAFEEHLASRHITEMLPIVLPLLSSPPDIRRYRKIAFRGTPTR